MTSIQFYKYSVFGVSQCTSFFGILRSFDNDVESTREWPTGREAVPSRAMTHDSPTDRHYVGDVRIKAKFTPLCKAVRLDSAPPSCIRYLWQGAGRGRVIPAVFHAVCRCAGCQVPAVPPRILCSWLCHPAAAGDVTKWHLIRIPTTGLVAPHHPPGTEASRVAYTTGRWLPNLTFLSFQ